jgi:AcrR family transcriptional regulator
MSDQTHTQEHASEGPADPEAVPAEDGAAARAGRRRGPSKGDRREQAIVDAVRRMILQRPISALSVEEIAAAAGISRSSFYFYFDSKYAALAAALDTVSAEIAAVTGDFGRNRVEPVAQFIPRMIADVAGLWRKHEHLLVGMADAAASDPAARQVWHAYMDRNVEAFAATIVAERAAGGIPPGPPDARALAEALLWMNERIYYLDRVKNAAPQQTQESVRALAAVWLAALTGGAVGKQPPDSQAF